MTKNSPPLFIWDIVGFLFLIVTALLVAYYSIVLYQHRGQPWNVRGLYVLALMIWVFFFVFYLIFAVNYVRGSKYMLAVAPKAN